MPPRFRRRRGAAFDLAVEPPLRAQLYALGENASARASMCCCCCCITSRATAGRLSPLWRDVAAVLRGAACGRCGGAAGAAGAVRRLHAVAAGRCWAMRGMPRARCRGSFRTGAIGLRVCRSSSICRPTGRVLRWRAIGAMRSRCALSAALHGALAQACAGERGEPVHGAAGGSCGAAEPAGRRH